MLAPFTIDQQEALLESYVITLDLCNFLLAILCELIISNFLYIIAYCQYP